MAKKLRSANASVAEKFIESTEKPTTEELEANGQQKLIDDQKPHEPKSKTKKEPSKLEDKRYESENVKAEPQEQTTPKVGQPKKYNEPVKAISFKLPESSIDKLRVLANLYNKSVTQYILGKIDDDYEVNKDIIDKINTIKKDM